MPVRPRRSTANTRSTVSMSSVRCCPNAWNCRDDEALAGMQVSLRLAFKRDGELLADPRFTYTTRDAPEKAKAAYQAAALDMLKHCTPLPLTDKFGGAIAGRPFVVAIRETRVLRAGDRPDDAAVLRGEPKP